MNARSEVAVEFHKLAKLVSSILIDICGLLYTWVAQLVLLGWMLGALEIKWIWTWN